MTALLDLMVAARETLAEDVVAFTLVHPHRDALPPWAPGDHIDLVADRTGADQLVRQYSLCGDPDDRSSYRIAVLREQDGGGGSEWIHANLHTGALVRASAPRSTFPYEPAARYVFIAGGIGVTPILPMVTAAARAGAEWRLAYAGRRLERMAFASELSSYGDRVSLHPKDELPLDLDEIVSTVDPVTAVYACGPERLLRALEDAMSDRPGQLRVERFENDNEVFLGDDRPFEVELSLSRRTITVEPGCSILQAVAGAGISVPSSCRGGTCGTCETFVVEGEVDHRDAILTAKEKEESEVMMICVSRAKGDRLVLEI